MMGQFSNSELNRINKNEHRELAMWDAVLNPDILAERDLEGDKHPSPEALFLQEALSKALMHHQREVWEMHTYDRMNYTQIAKKLRITEGAVRSRLKTIRKQIMAWCMKHKEAYLAIKEAQE